MPHLVCPADQPDQSEVQPSTRSIYATYRSNTVYGSDMESQPVGWSHDDTAPVRRQSRERCYPTTPSGEVILRIKTYRIWSENDYLRPTTTRSVTVRAHVASGVHPFPHYEPGSPTRVGTEDRLVKPPIARTLNGVRSAAAVLPARGTPFSFLDRRDTHA